MPGTERGASNSNKFDPMDFIVHADDQDINCKKSSITPTPPSTLPLQARFNPYQAIDVENDIEKSVKREDSRNQSAFNIRRPSITSTSNGVQVQKNYGVPSNNVQKLKIQTPTLVRIGTSSTFHSNPTPSYYGKVATPSLKRSFQHVNTNPEDNSNVYAKRMRTILSNQQKLALCPTIRPFTSEADMVAQLSCYHIFQSEQSPSNHELKKRHEKYLQDTIRLSNGINDLLTRYHNISINKNISNVNDEIILLKSFIKTETERKELLYKQNYQIKEVINQEGDPNTYNEFGAYESAGG